MKIILGILQGTPSWVFVVFALLVWLGLQARKSRVVSFWRIAITPAVFIGWGLVALALAARSVPLVAVDWLIAAACGAALAAMTARIAALHIDRARGRIHLPGSSLPLIRNLLIFAAKFGIAVAGARRPDLRHQLIWWDIAVSGLSAGYFTGWLTRLAVQYLRTPVNFSAARDGAAG